MTVERVLDVSDLAPPEPLERALEAVRELPPGGYVRMLHWREPLLLYPLLEEQGLRWTTRAGRETAYEILIWRRGDAEAEAAALATGTRP